ncbi:MULTISPECIES: amidase [unclassified Paracoccus (in: a-proteobacteria)]|uniref:amidase n=1 Tax=unclassified Paracoccus (in: a-proteobacteria) TaxID=2688777 RepID=UPI0021E0FCB9|nr:MULTISPECIES: amidase [unclassified Paracoccus (in: a-proteobacteria)]UXU76638.1 amidase [Paracoccus sp. SMMA_5]UXU82526.1 amidase [Paracoccus sp. SMMA_5_TC]
MSDHPATASDPTALSALALSRAIHDRRISCAEVMAAYLDRIEAVNPRVNALVSLRPREALLQEARRADDELAAGTSRGWLHGIPQAPKDLTATRDVVTTMGFVGLRHNLPGDDSVLVARTRAAGAIIIGKTNTPEFGLGSHTYNPLFGTTLNAYDPRVSAGGSSGGAAVALATQMLPVADGSDMMGSLRNPAGWNNVYGFRPSMGRVPFGPVPEVFFQQLGHEGPMARNVADLAMLLATQAGHDPRMPLSLPGDGAEFAAPLTGAARGKRIGWLGDLGGYLPMQPGVLDSCRAGLKLIESLGATVEDVRPDFDMARLWTAWITLRSFLVSGAMAALYDNPKSRALLKPEAIWEIEQGRALSGAQVFAASAVRSAWYQEMLRLFDRYDYLLLPTAQVFAFDASQHWPQDIAGQPMDSYHRWMEVVIPGSMAGVPVLAVPAGFGPQGTPMGLQVMAPPRADRTVLEFGHAYDLAQEFTARKSPLIQPAAALPGDHQTQPRRFSP